MQAHRWITRLSHIIKRQKEAIIGFKKEIQRLTTQLNSNGYPDAARQVPPSRVNVSCRLKIHISNHTDSVVPAAVSDDAGQ